MLSQCGLIRSYVGGILQQTGRLLFYTRTRRPSLVPIAHVLQPVWAYTFQTPLPISAFSRTFQTLAPLESTLNYGIAASFSAKAKKFNPSNISDFNKEPSESIALARDDIGGKKVSGEDAYFITTVNTSSRNMAFGVADGVGGWNDSGIDPADFSHNLCKYMAKAAKEVNDVDVPRLTARDILEVGYQELVHSRSVRGGGSTACVGLARADGQFEVANLGDSGYILIRLNGIQHASKPQTHSFNTPYQLSLIPPHILYQMALFGGSPISDLPSDADVTRLQLQHGDVVVLGTDGLWDNLSAQDVLKVVSKCMIAFGAWKPGNQSVLVCEDLTTMIKEPLAKSRNTLQGIIAAVIAGEAKRASLNTKLDSPFAKESRKYFPQDNYRGGKIDDICVVVLVAADE